MKVKVELLKGHIADFINNNIEDFEIDASRIADTTATKILTDIQMVLKNEDYSDFEAIEEIICIFEKYTLDFGSRHDL